ncbi:hypothetical protein LXL04_029238 [Taraxacum kok-saghyz]
MANRNLEKLASINAQSRLLVLGKVSEDDNLIEYDALLLDKFLDILQDLHGEDLKETVQECYELSAEYEGKRDPEKLEELGSKKLLNDKAYIRRLGIKDGDQVIRSSYDEDGDLNDVRNCESVENVQVESVFIHGSKVANFLKGWFSYRKFRNGIITNGFQVLFLDKLGGAESTLISAII